jgi:hypothetical protein
MAETDCSSRMVGRGGLGGYWVSTCHLTSNDVKKQFSDGIRVYTYANNHYAGNGLQTIDLFWKLLA